MMHRKLPAELRELLYRYTCVEDQPIPVGPYYHFRQYEYSPLVKQRLDLEARLDIVEPNSNSIHFAPVSNGRDNYITLPDGRLKYDHSKKVPDHIIMPDYHLFDDEYAGAKIAAEAQTFYYKNNTFSLCNLDQGIARFLDLGRSVGIRDDRVHSRKIHDESGKVKPIDVVRNLQIRVKFDHYLPFLDAIMEDATSSEKLAYQRNFLRKARSELNILQNIPVQDRMLNIEFVIMTALQYDEDMWCAFTNMLQSLREDVYRLMYDRNDTSIKVIHHDDSLTPFPRNLTRLWSLTKDQWRYVRPRLHPSGAKRSNVLTISQESARNAELAWPSASGDWTAEFYVGECVREKKRMHGIPKLQLPDVLKERWGIKHLLKDTEPRWPIKEGRYWPVYDYLSAKY
jgi:hypothetical protein